MPQEKLTWKFFHNGAGSEKAESLGDFARILDRWMSQPDEYKIYRERFLQLRYEEDPTVVIRELVDLAREACGGKPLTAAPFVAAK